MKNNLTPPLKGAQRTADNKTQRLKHAAELSRTRTATEICTDLGISTRTLKRYMADPLWQENGGIQLELTQRGRPKRTTLSETEKRTLTEAYALHEQGRTWVEVAEILEMTLRALQWLRRNETVQDTLSHAEKRTLAEAYRLHDAGMKWVEVASELEIPIGRLEYLRRKERSENKTENKTA